MQPERPLTLMSRIIKRIVRIKAALRRCRWKLALGRTCGPFGLHSRAKARPRLYVEAFGNSMANSVQYRPDLCRLIS